MESKEVPLPEGASGPTALVTRARAGDRSALDEIVRTHAASVYRIVAAYVGREEAEDATQEVFVHVQEGLPSFEGRSQLGTWILRIATNVALKRLRRRRRKPPPKPLEDHDHPAAPDADPSMVLADLELKDAFRSALGSLPHDQRAVVVLRGIEGLPFDEVARTLGIPTPTAHSRMARACERLRRLLGRFVDAPSRAQEDEHAT